MPVIVPEDFVREREPAPVPAHRGEVAPPYRLHEGRVSYRGTPLRGADVATFRFYAGSFAKDARHCYRQSSRLKDADPSSFRALNFCWFADATRVWALGGELRDVERSSFEVLDDGADLLALSSLVPTGYARDRSRVYYYDFDGKPNVVKRATSASFISLDRKFGHDDARVFFGIHALPGARPASWRRLDDRFSIDEDRVYFLHRLVEGADAATFHVIESRGVPYAADAHRLYQGSEVITAEERARREATAARPKGRPPSTPT